ncbi:MAG: DUF4293 domain-containing protein [Flavobacteriales bacterium]|nr:DUF4293 domain-containing protein [Flavobacteriales bacterium]
MIQRIQSVYLIIAILLLAMPMMLRMALFTVQVPEGAYKLYPANVLFNGQEVLSTIVVLASITMSVMLLVYAIMQFKNRGFQMNLIKVSILSQLSFLVAVFFYLDKVKSLAESATEPAISYSPLLSAPVVAVFFCMLAIRSIKKDEALVRSADRLR